MHPSTDAERLNALVTTMSERMAHITRTLGTWVQHEAHDLQEIEQHVLRLIKEVGTTLVAGLCALTTPAQPAPSVPCPCGQTAQYQRQRPATVTTILGPITVPRAYYLCPTCHQGHHPLDQQLQLCAGSRSGGLDELLALLGATQDSFADAASLVERLTLLHLSPNTVRDATEALGAVVVTEQVAHAAAAEQGVVPAAVDATPPERLYITMDGILAHLHERGWSEVKVGACYQTTARPQPTRPEQVDIRAQHLSYVSAVCAAEGFGWQLWQEAARRGVLAATEVVVVGDGAHWIWNLAETHFPTATQIVDWYHASEYVWAAAKTIWTEPAACERWAHQQLDALWAGRVTEVLAACERHAAAGEGVRQAISYFTTHQTRMDYAAYRARGLQIGSGSVESGCKQLVTARLKQAGMIWTAEGAERVAAVRAWLKSGRWTEAVALRPRAGRTYQRHTPMRATSATPRPPTDAPAHSAPPAGSAAAGSLPPAVLAAVRASQAADQRQHPWRKPWSRRQQALHHQHQAPPEPLVVTA